MEDFGTREERASAWNFLLAWRLCVKNLKKISRKIAKNAREENPPRSGPCPLIGITGLQRYRSLNPSEPITQPQ